MGLPAKVEKAPLPDKLVDLLEGGAFPPGRDLYPEELELLDEFRLEAMRLWAHAYVKCWNNRAACEACGRSDDSVRYWVRTDKNFAKLHAVLIGEALEAWRAHAANKAGNAGFKKVLYDAEGNVKAVEVREDPGYLKAHMASIDPNWRPNDDKSQEITIVINRTEE